MRLLYSIFFVVILIISGCSNHLDNEIKKEQELEEDKTIEQAILDSGIPTSDIVYTEEIGDQAAFSLFQLSNGYGVMNLSKKENGWNYVGNSTTSQDEAEDFPFFTFFESSWLQGELYENDTYYSIYPAVLFGVINNSEIDKIMVEFENMKETANLVERNGKRFWYFAYERNESSELVREISAYSSDGTLIYTE